jgi:hypothetical protein
MRRNETMRNEDLIYGVGAGCGLSIVSLIVAILTGRKSKATVQSISDRINVAVDDLMNSEIEVDISESIINTAVKKKTEEEVGRMTTAACSEAKKKIAGEFYDIISREVNAQYDSVKNEVAAEIKRQVGRIDINEVKKQVVRQAKEEAMERFHEDLEGVLEKYNDQLADVGKIYNSIAKSFDR